MPNDRDFITGPVVGPEALALAGGMPTDGKEIRYDSSALRAQYEQGLGGVPGDTLGMLGPPIPDSAFNPSSLPPEDLPPEIIEAMRRGQPPPDLRQFAATRGDLPPMLPPPQVALSQPSRFGMVLPLGDGVTAHIAFTGEPGVKQWKRLLKHLLIEAEEDETETGDLQRSDVPDDRGAPGHVARRKGPHRADGA